MAGRSLETYDEVYVLCKKLVRRYAIGRSYYLNSVGLSPDDLVSEVILRLFKYNGKLLDYPSIDSTLLCHVVFRHIYYVVNTYAKKRSRLTDTMAHMIQTQARASPYTTEMFEIDCNSVLDSIVPESSVERDLLCLLKNPTRYWQWVASTQTDCRPPSVRRISTYLKVSAYKVRVAIARIGKEITCENLL